MHNIPGTPDWRWVTSLPLQICFITTIKWQLIHPNLLGKHGTYYLYFTEFCDSEVISSQSLMKKCCGIQQIQDKRNPCGAWGTIWQPLLAYCQRLNKNSPVSKFSQRRRFSMSHSSLLFLPTLSPASHMVSSSSAAPSAKYESQDSNQENSTQQVYLSQSHFFTFLSMEIQLLIIFANQNLHLNTKNNTRSFLCLLFSPSPLVLSHPHTQYIKSSLTPRIGQRTTAFACC